MKYSTALYNDFLGSEVWYMQDNSCYNMSLAYVHQAWSF